MASNASGQTGPKRNDVQRNRDRARVAALAAMGFTQRQIEAKMALETREEGYTVNFRTIGRDLATVEASWREERIEDIQRRRLRLQSQIDYVQQEATMAWDLSKEKRRESSVAKTERRGANQEAGGMPPPVTEERRTMREVEATPDWRFLGVVIDCIKKSAQLWGADVRPDEVGVGGTGTPAPDPKILPYAGANLVLASIVRGDNRPDENVA